MDIALVVEHFEPRSPGGQYAQRLARRLVDQGHEVWVISASCDNPQRWPGVQIAAMDDKPAPTARQLPRFARFASRQLNSSEPGMSLSLTTAVAADILQLTEGVFPELRARLKVSSRSMTDRLRGGLTHTLNPAQACRRRLEQRTLADPRIRQVIAPSGYVREQLKTHYGLDEQRLTVIHPGSAFNIPNREQRLAWRHNLRRAFAISEQSFACVFPESHYNIHGFETALAAAHSLQDHSPDHVLVLAGGIGFRAYQRLTDEGLHETVRVVGHTRRMDALLSAADLTVFPTFYDPAGRAVIDSLRMGVPVVTTAYCGSSELLEPPEGQRSGHVLDDPGDAAALSRTVSEFADADHRQPYDEAAAELGEQLTFAGELEQLEGVMRRTRAA